MCFTLQVAWAMLALAIAAPSITATAAILYSTYLGGSYDEEAAGIAVLRLA
jgi:hypothetical protein